MTEVLINNCDVKGIKFTRDVRMSLPVLKTLLRMRGQAIRLKITMPSPTPDYTYVLRMCPCALVQVAMQRNSSSLCKMSSMLENTTIPGLTYKVESGAQSTRMHYGAAAASVLVMTGVTFLNSYKS